MSFYRHLDVQGVATPTAFGGHPGIDIPNPGDYTGLTWLYGATQETDPG